MNGAREVCDICHVYHVELRPEEAKQLKDLYETNEYREIDQNIISDEQMHVLKAILEQIKS
jgi:hypothetical protein